MARLSHAFSGHRRLSVAALVAAAAAGLAAGVLLARGSGAKALVVGKPGVVSSGRFHTLEWPTKGQASLVRLRDGSLVLRFSSDFRTEDAPELFIFTSAIGREREQLVALRRATGHQQYSVSAELANERGVQVIIWCGKCHKDWGFATLAPTAHV